MDQQQADKRDIRARAQQVFTTTFVLGAAIAASYSSGGGHGTPGKLIYLAAAALTGFARLAAGGIITARSAIGAPYLANILAAPPGELERRPADEYAATRYTGAATVAALVTVLRDCVLVLILGFTTFACAHVWAWAPQLPALQFPCASCLTSWDRVTCCIDVASQARGPFSRFRLTTCAELSPPAGPN